MIYLLYATKVNVGGWMTFTRHLRESLQQQGINACIVKLGNRDEPFIRLFNDGYDGYQNMSLETLLIAAAHGELIITALGKHYVEQSLALIAAGAKVVCHDPAEPAFTMKLRSPWVIRRSMLAHLPHATFIRHPYVRQQRTATKRTKAIIAPSRVDFDKNTIMILDANRLGAKIDIVGFENRLYAKFKIIPNYPEWEQSGGYRRPKDVSTFSLLETALAMVDLTDIKGDGGGTQYTFLEAWDAGAIPIIGAWWIRSKDDMNERNCVWVKDAQELATTVKKLRKYHRFDIAASGQHRLARYHAPKVIVPQVMEWLNAR